MASLVLLVVAAVAVAGGAAGPLFLRSADDSALVAAARSQPSTAGIEILGQGGAAPYRRLRRAVAHRPGGRKDWYAPPQLTAEGEVDLSSARGLPYGGLLLSSTDLCAHVHMLEGLCPTSEGTVAVSARTARALEVAVGTKLVFREPHAAGRLRVSVTGVYRLPTITPAGYWDSGSAFDFGDQPKGLPPQVDAFLATPRTVLASASIGSLPQLLATLSVHPPGLRDGPVSALRRSVVAFRTVLEHQGFSVSTGVLGLLGHVRSSDRTAATAAWVAALQLVVLGLLVVYLVVATAAEDRRTDVELAVRRGFARRQLVLVAIGESALLLAVAFPIGLGLTWLAVTLAARALMQPGTPVTFPLSSLAVGAAVTVGGLAAVLIATADLWRGPRRAVVRESRARSARAAADALAVALGAAGAVAFASGGALSGRGGTNPVALIGPALLAVGAGVVGLRVAELGASATVRLTRRSTSLSTFLAARALARRRPRPLRRVLALTSAVVLVIFGVLTWSAAQANRSRVAAVQTGAQRVVDVSTRPGFDLGAAVDRADPGGHTAMAVAVVHSSSGVTLAIQASRLAAVAAWPPHLADQPLRSIARYLSPPTVPPVTFAGDGLRATLTLPPRSPRLTLTATVYNEAGQNQETLAFPTLHPGTATYTASAGGFCTTACRLLDLSPTLAPGARAANVSMVLRNLAVDGDRPLPIYAGRPGSWSAQPPTVGVSSAAGGVRFTVPSGEIGVQGVLLAPADVPAEVPAVATRTIYDLSATQTSNTFSVTGLDGNGIDVRARVISSGLPEIGTSGVLVDLTFAQRLQTAPTRAQEQVWLHGPGQAAVLRRLRAEGVRLGASVTAATRLRQLGATSLAVAYDLVIGTAAVAALLALGATLFTLIAGARRRRRGLHALLVAGVPLRSLRRALAAETMGVLGVALVVGGVVGYAVSALALGSLPLVAGGTGGVPLSRSIAGLPLVAVLTVLGGALLLVTAATTTALSGRRGRRVVELGP
ncbi:MAG TPA: ABC transporter permease [Acidimicrobiales bacterium]|nr:ABC transporter permease [Acidimicrobiales bacterium]